MTVPNVPYGGPLESAAQNALIAQSNETAAQTDTQQTTIDGHTTQIAGLDGRIDALEIAPPSHTHPISQVTSLQATLDGKAATSHTHTITQVTNLQTALDAKAATAVTDALDGRIDALETADPPASSLGELSDVDTTTVAPVDGQTLKWSASSALWVPGNDLVGSGGGGGGATTLDELDDVATTGATAGQALVYGGSAWSPGAPAPAAHTHTISDVTGLQSALDAKATASSVTTLSGRVSTLETAAASLTPTTASDTALYGDVISSHQRSDCQWGESLGNGYMTAVATRSAKTFTATDLRLCVTTAATGAGTFDLKLYTGSSLSALTERVFRFGDTHITTTGVRHLDIGNLAISEGQYIAVCMIVTGWTGSPRLSSTPTGSGAQLLIGDQPYSVYQAGQTFPPPASLNMTEAKWTRANQLFWFALA